jgi:NADH-quinone oxidoreductase subunit N
LNTLILLAALGILCLFSEIFNFRKLLLPIVYIGLAAALPLAINDWNTSRAYFNNMVVFDNFAIAFTALILVISFFWIISSPPFFQSKEHETDQVSLVVFSIIGAIVMTSFNNMIMLFLGLEILSISMYVLAGSNKKSLFSNEAALKYFLMGSFATCFFLFGTALIYGSTGSFYPTEIASALSGAGGDSAIIYTGITFIAAAMAFKISVVPFHLWAPDVYQGSPTIYTSFMSTVVKTAAIAAFFRLFTVAFPFSQEAWTTSLWIIAAASILIGNITAVYQTNFKRMLAYSGISHAGYMLLALLAMNQYSAGSLLFYSAAYSVSAITSFLVLLIVSKTTGNDQIESFNGLAKKNPLLSVVTVIAMLSLAGIPPTAGFFAKYYIFSAAIQKNLTALVLIAVAGSLIGVFYYFKVIIALFKEGNTQEVSSNGGLNVILLLTSVLAIILGVFPGLLSGLL